MSYERLSKLKKYKDEFLAEEGEYDCYHTSHCCNKIGSLLNHLKIDFKKGGFYFMMPLTFKGLIGSYTYPNFKSITFEREIVGKMNDRDPPLMRYCPFCGAPIILRSSCQKMIGDR